MKEDYDPSLVFKIPSALFATVLALPMVLFSFGYWILKPTVTVPYAVVLVLSGWAFAFGRWRIAGFIHAALMFGIAGFSLHICLGNFGVPLADNPAGGLVGVATLIYLIIGVLAAICGAGAAHIALKRA